MKKINEHIKKAYEASGMSKVEFAKRACISKSYGTALANGKLPDIDIPERTLEGIAKALGTTVQWLQSGKGPMFIRDGDRISEENATYNPFEEKLVYLKKIYNEAPTEDKAAYEEMVSKCVADFAMYKYSEPVRAATRSYNERNREVPPDEETDNQAAEGATRRKM